MGEKLTETDIEKIKEEIRHREEDLRPQLIDDVKETRAMGDLSENFEYHAAKGAKNRNESRIRYLKNVLQHATVVSDKSEDGVVGINNTVTIYIPAMNVTQTVKITTSIRSDSQENKVSIESPIGRALMGKKAGDTVTVRVSNDYSYEAEIKSIDQSSGEDDDKIRSY